MVSFCLPPRTSSRCRPKQAGIASLSVTKSSGIMFASAFLQVNFKSAQVSFE